MQNNMVVALASGCFWYSKDTHDIRWGQKVTMPWDTGMMNMIVRRRLGRKVGMDVNFGYLV